MSAEAVGALQYALQQNGSSLEKLGTLLDNLANSQLQAFTDQNSTAARTFQAIGVSVTDANGRLKDAQQLFAEVSARLSQYADGAAKSAIATNLFKDASAETIAVLNQGAEGLQHQANEARALNQVLSGRTVGTLNTIKDVWDRLGTALKGVFNTIANLLIPYLEPLAGWIRNVALSTSNLQIAFAAVDFVLKALIATAIAGVASFQALGVVISGVASALMALGRLDLAGAATAITSIPDEIKRKFEEAIASVKLLFSGIGEWVTTVTPAIAGATAPVVASVGSVRDALREWRDEQRALMDDIVGLKTETFDAKMAAIRAALDNGIIGMRQFGQLTRRITEETASNWERVASTLASTLTAVFGKSKAAAIASAVINTAVGITQALRSLPPPLSWIQAGLIAASGAAQIATIKSTNASGGGSTPSVSGGGGGSASDAAAQPAQMINVNLHGSRFSREDVLDLMDQISGAVQDGAQIVVSR